MLKFHNALVPLNIYIEIKNKILYIHFIIQLIILINIIILVFVITGIIIDAVV